MMNEEQAASSMRAARKLELGSKRQDYKAELQYDCPCQYNGNKLSLVGHHVRVHAGSTFSMVTGRHHHCITSLCSRSQSKLTLPLSPNVKSESCQSCMHSHHFRMTAKVLKLMMGLLRQWLTYIPLSPVTLFLKKGFSEIQGSIISLSLLS